jgi:hypothetical protein
MGFRPIDVFVELAVVSLGLETDVLLKRSLLFPISGFGNIVIPNTKNPKNPKPIKYKIKGIPCCAIVFPEWIRIP